MREWTEKHIRDLIRQETVESPSVKPSLISLLYPERVSRLSGALFANNKSESVFVYGTAVEGTVVFAEHDSVVYVQYVIENGMGELIGNIYFPMLVKNTYYANGDLYRLYQESDDVVIPVIVSDESGEYVGTLHMRSQKIGDYKYDRLKL